MLKILYATLIVLFLYNAVLPARAAQNAPHNDVTDMIAGKNDMLAVLINREGNHGELVQFLHTHISDEATFLVTVKDQTTGMDDKSPAMQLTKADYINSYLQGAHLIKDYKVAIDTLSVAYDQDNKQAVSIDVMTERGMMINPVGSQNTSPRIFISRTTCRTLHKITDDKAVSQGSACHTDISYEEQA